MFKISRRKGKGSFLVSTSVTKMNKKSGYTKKQDNDLKNYPVVKRMDVFFADLSSDGVGSEQFGIRPVLVIQNDVGNQFSPTIIISSITAKASKAKLPTHIELNAKKYGLEKDSLLLLEQIRTIDKQRLIRKITHLEGPVVDEIQKALLISLGLIKF